MTSARCPPAPQSEFRKARVPAIVLRQRANSFRFGHAASDPRIESNRWPCDGLLRGHIECANAQQHLRRINENPITPKSARSSHSLLSGLYKMPTKARNAGIMHTTQIMPRRPPILSESHLRAPCLPSRNSSVAVPMRPGPGSRASLLSETSVPNRAWRSARCRRRSWRRR